MSLLSRLFPGRSRERTGVQSDDPSNLERPGDPRGGLQSEEYRTADPRDVVESEGETMAGPGGTPQDGVEGEPPRPDLHEPEQ